MRRPSKVKAGLLISLIGVPLTLATTLGAMFGAFAVSDAVFVYGSVSLEGWWLIDFLSWAVPILLTVLGAVTGVVLTALIVIDRFPFGRYRLRLMPKDDPTPEIFA